MRPICLEIGEFELGTDLWDHFSSVQAGLYAFPDSSSGSLLGPAWGPLGGLLKQALPVWMPTVTYRDEYKDKP